MKYNGLAGSSLGTPGSGGGETPTKKTIIKITGQIAANTPLSLTASGANYTKSGNNGDILSSAALFDGSFVIRVAYNGLEAEKGVIAIWASQTTMQISNILDNGDTLIIFS